MASITLAWIKLPTVIGIKIEKDTRNQWEAESVACNPFGFEFPLKEQCCEALALSTREDRFWLYAA